MPNYMYGKRTNIINRNGTCVGLDSHSNASNPPPRLRPTGRMDNPIQLFSAPKTSSGDGEPKTLNPFHPPGLNDLDDGLYSTPNGKRRTKSGLVYVKRSVYPQRTSDSDRSDLSVGLDAVARAGGKKDEVLATVTSVGLTQNEVIVARKRQNCESEWMKKKTKRVLSGLKLHRKQQRPEMDGEGDQGI